MRPHRLPALLPTLLLAAACTTEGVTTAAARPGVLRVQLTDAPFPFDSVRTVDVWVVRVDARLAEGDSADAARGAPDDSASAGGWVTLVRPDRAFDLLTLRNGTIATLGQDTLPPGRYRGLRLVLDPSRSRVTLVDGTVLHGGSTPSVTFPSGARSGLKVTVTQPIVVGADSTSTVLLDFDLEQSFVMRGNSIRRNGLLFTPVIRAAPRVVAG